MKNNTTSIIDNIKTGNREFYDDKGQLIKSYAREILHDKDFEKIYGKQVQWGYFPCQLPE